MDWRLVTHKVIMSLKFEMMVSTARQRADDAAMKSNVCSDGCLCRTVLAHRMASKLVNKWFWAHIRTVKDQLSAVNETRGNISIVVLSDSRFVFDYISNNPAIDISNGFCPNNAT